MRKIPLLLIPLVLMVLVFGVQVAQADRWYKATALDTEGNESGFSNVVVLTEFQGTITLAWDPNTEPDIMGYRIWINCVNEYGFIPIPIEILHLDYCLETCEITLDLNNPTIIIGGTP
jgi:hypothetical protein